jgi:FSR family fosmidomycin resistance protein-like MFS transporter
MLSFCHLLNDLMQSMIPAIYPMLKRNLDLSFTQIGLITLAFQLSASMLQPAVGLLTDRRPLPYSLIGGMFSTLIGLLMLSQSGTYIEVLPACVLIGVGSAIFHPEASRVARIASGGSYGFAQSVFQLGGNIGQAVGPLMAAIFVLPKGQIGLAWLGFAALIAIFILIKVARFYKIHLRNNPSAQSQVTTAPLDRTAFFSLGVLIVLLLSKNAYTASLSSYYTFYLIDKFGLEIQDAQLQLFMYMVSVATGTVLGGLLTDRYGHRPMIWFSILGALPFTIALPWAGPVGSAVLTICIGIIMASAFPAILIYAHELAPKRVGLISGIFFGLSFGLGGLAAAIIGTAADSYGIVTVYQTIGLLPALGLCAILLPKATKQPIFKS